MTWLILFGKFFIYKNVGNHLRLVSQYVNGFGFRTGEYAARAVLAFSVSVRCQVAGMPQTCCDKAEFSSKKGLKRFLDAYFCIRWGMVGVHESML